METVLNGIEFKRHYNFLRKGLKTIPLFVVPFNALNVTFLLCISHQPFLYSHVQLLYFLSNDYSTDDVTVNYQSGNNLPMIIRNNW